MGFAGNLHTLSLVEVFQTLARIKATGVLRLASDAGGRDVVFDAGAIIGVAFRAGERKQALLKRLILLGKLDAHSAAGLSATGSESAVVKAVVDQGWVSADDVSIAYEAQAREELQSLSSWDYADFIFEDAGPEQQLASQLVDRYRRFPIKVDMSHLLIESARRADEWNRMREVITDPQAVYSPASGSEKALHQISKEYPASAIVPLIDGVRTVEDVTEESVSTRLDIYGVIVELLEQSLLVQLTPEQILDNAEHLFSTMDFGRAARLYRLLMSQKSSNPDLGTKLAACLEHLGDPQEAAACLSQLSLQQLDQGDVEAAEKAARRAVELAGERPDARLALIRCLLQTTNSKEAIEQLQQLVVIHLKLGHLEEARATCLKILSIEPTDDIARRQLARIFSQGDHEQLGEDVVVCIRCDHVNHREATVCAKCSTPLHLACLSCQRIVGVSDKLCIFCGADPHAGAPKREAAGRPSTARFVKSERISNDKKGVAEWREKIHNLLQQATNLEAAGDLVGSLEVWREVASFQHDSSEVQARIREIELRVNNKYVQEQIAQGHRLRKGRRFWRALQCYRRALQSMPGDDPRVAPLRDIVATTRRWHRRNAAFYTAACLVLFALAGMTLAPYYSLHQLRSRATGVQDDIALASTGGAADVIQASSSLNALTIQAEHIRGHAGLDAKHLLLDLEGELAVARTHAASQEMHAITTLIDQESIEEAAKRIAGYGAAFDNALSTQLEVQEHRLMLARKTMLERDLLIKDGPARLARAQAREQANALSDALNLYRTLVASPDKGIVATATAGVRRLEPQLSEVQGQVEAAEALMGKDLRAADAAFLQLTEVALYWDLGQRVHERRELIAKRLQQATQQWALLSQKSDVGQLQRFLADYPGAAESEIASARLAMAHEQQNSREQSLARYHQAMDKQSWADAWQFAKDLLVIDSHGVNGVQAAFPLVVETMPSGVTVAVNGKTIGRTPCLVTWSAPASGDIDLTADGWHAVRMSLQEAGKSWRLALRLTRQERWRADLRHAPSTLLPTPTGGILAVTSEALIALDRAGKQVWSHALPHAGDDTESHSRTRHVPTLLPGGALAIALPDQNLELLDHDGQRTALYPTTAEVRGIPVLYSNELMGGQPRLAFAGESLFVGSLGDAPQALALPAAVLAGPVVLPKDLDRILAVVDLRGHLIGFEESTRKQLWDLDLQASDCSNLVAAGSDLYATTLDGSRVALLSLAQDGPSLRWLKTLPGPALGDPVVLSGLVEVSCGDTICRFALDGTALAPLKLTAPAVTPLASFGEMTAVACQDATVSLFQGETRVWQSSLPGVATSVALCQSGMLVGLSDGSLLSLLP
jgi:tetratricopeptide (TPR) repeat protein